MAKMATLMKEAFKDSSIKVPRVPLKQCPEKFAEYRGWRNRMRTLILTSGANPRRVVNYIKRMDDKRLPITTIYERIGE